jgi:DUF438 domain-containing protein
VGRTANLRRQHDAALDLIAQITAKLTIPLDHDGAYALSLLFSKLTGMLRIHFVQEDKTLYPYMLNSSNTAASETAAAFQAEMGDLGPVYHDFAQKWSSSAAISKDQEGFRQESASVFAALATRIQRENQELYPLADAIEFHEIRNIA